MADKLTHIPVLLEEVIELLDPQPGETLVDCTAGLGGHAAAIARLLGPAGRVVLGDLDDTYLDRARETVAAELGSDRVMAVRGSFADLPRWLAENDITADLVLADLGFASTQVDDPSRGLSFRADGPLDMRLDRSAPITAGELVNTTPEDDLAEIIRRYGEERHARRIAAKLVAARLQAPIETTHQLADIVRSACPRHTVGIDPATRTFQALRIAVNDEIGSLKRLLELVGRGARGGGWLNQGARIAVIAFHSLEDRPVKKAMAGLIEQGLATGITRKPVIAGPAEVGVNPRARSAKLRVIRLSG